MRVSMIVASSGATVERLFVVMTGLGAALFAYAMSFRIGDKCLPRNGLDRTHYELAPIERRIGLVMIAVGLIGLAVTVFIRR